MSIIHIDEFELHILANLHDKQTTPMGALETYDLNCLIHHKEA